MLKIYNITVHLEISYSDLCTIMSMVPTMCYFVNKAADNWILDMKMIFC